MNPIYFFAGLALVCGFAALRLSDRAKVLSLGLALWLIAVPVALLMSRLMPWQEALGETGAPTAGGYVLVIVGAVGVLLMSSVAVASACRVFWVTCGKLYKLFLKSSDKT